jgi:CDGSH-type Zn-finger protein
MNKGAIAGRAPIGVDVETGKIYFWCTCGGSATQPFCDDSHRGTDFSPKSYVADRSGKVWFCNCKQTSTAPLCDGTHKTLS